MIMCIYIYIYIIRLRMLRRNHAVFTKMATLMFETASSEVQTHILIQCIDWESRE
jgi:hypothetical protein